MFLTAEQIAALEVKVAKYNRKAKRLKQAPVLFKVGKLASGPNQDEWEVHLEGEQPRIHGYEVLGKVEPLSDGINLVLPIPGKQIPAYYRQADIECEHCGHNRRRNFTVVLKNVETGATKQVGNTCLQDYLRDKNAAELIGLNLLWVDFADKSVLSDEEYRIHRSRHIHLSEFLSYVCRSIRLNGFTSKRESPFNNTATQAMNAYRDTLITPSIEDHLEASETLDYIRHMSRDQMNSDFMYNLWSLSQVELVCQKSIGYVAYMPVAYKKEKLRQSALQENKTEFFGIVGNKFYAVATLTDIRQMGDAAIARFENEEGNVLSWWSNKPLEFKVGDKVILSGTVKAHKVYGNERTTQIVRPKVRLLA